MIVTLTMNPAVDKSTSVEKLMPEHKLRCSPLVTEAGGGGINVSKALKKLGQESLAVFPAGQINGSILENYLCSQEINFRTIPISGETRENMVVRESTTNAQYRFVLPGPSLSQAEADAALELVKTVAPRIIVASGSLPPGVSDDFYGHLAELAQSIKARIIVDCSGPALLKAASKGVYLLKPNLRELSLLAGKEELQLDDVDEAAQEILNQGLCEVMVVSLGAGGALLVTKDHYEHIPAPTVKKQSTVGAGDSMVAGMVWMLAAGKSLAEMVRFGVACGTAATMNPGTELFHKADVEKLFNWLKNR